MFLFKPSAVLLGSLLLAATVQPGAARAQHAHAAHSGVTQPPPPSQRWQADADLRDGMARIHAALAQLRHEETGPLDTAFALDRVGRIEQAAADIFARCQLTPQKDAVMHAMLARLLGAAQKFQANPRDVAQLAAMREAVADYPRYFNDPGWSAVRAPD